MCNFPQTIDLATLGHGESLFARKLHFVDTISKVARYYPEGMIRIIGDINDIQSIDFDGGPFITIGDEIYNFVVTGFTYNEKDKVLYILITECSI